MTTSQLLIARRDVADLHRRSLDQLQRAKDLLAEAKLIKSGANRTALVGPITELAGNAARTARECVALLDRINALLAEAA